MTGSSLLLLLQEPVLLTAAFLVLPLLLAACSGRSDAQEIRQANRQSRARWAVIIGLITSWLWLRHQGIRVSDSQPDSIEGPNVRRVRQVSS